MGSQPEPPQKKEGRDHRLARSISGRDFSQRVYAGHLGSSGHICTPHLAIEGRMGKDIYLLKVFLE
jgi:hypothetical protein